MKINATILSIPPYLSTTWKNISSIHVREERGSFTLIVLLQNRISVEVPGLDKETIDLVFEAHVRSAEGEARPRRNPLETPFSMSLPLKTDGLIGSLGSGMQHNPDQADLEPLPPEILKKISTIAKAFGVDEITELPKAEPHCNCMYCQVMRSLNASEESEESIEVAEQIAPEDLQFRDWEIKQTGNHLYDVTSPLDKNEHYHVFLGEPLGCTCGEKNCEHIRAVLNS